MVRNEGSSADNDEKCKNTSINAKVCITSCAVLAQSSLPQGMVAKSQTAKFRLK
jgi:hypothetical protein